MELNQVINADCMDIMKDIPDGFVDMCLTSPPYNAGKSAISGGHKKKSYNSHNDNMDYSDYLEWIIEVINEMLRITKYHIFFNIQETNNTLGIYRDIENRFDGLIKETFYWVKNNPPSHIVDTQCSNGYEKIYCLSFDNPQIKKFSYCNFSNANGDYMRNTIITNVNSESTFHKFAMPLKIPKHFIKYFSKETDIIFDPFSGSGTTALACIDLNRKYLCIEKDKDYYEQSLKRIDKELVKIKMFD